MNIPLTCYWWSHPCIESVFNFGDLLNPLLMNAYGLIDYTRPDTGGVRVRAATNYVIVGSILDDFWDNHALTILGAGLLKGGNKNLHNSRVLALRGKLTQEKLGRSKENITLGDPGLLTSRIIPIPRDDSDDKPIGIIPHWKHAASPRLDKYRYDKRYKIINPHAEPQIVAHEICACSVIAADSLHGLILADSYGVPNIRVSFLDGVVDTSDFKYLDYFSAIGRAGEAAKAIKPEDISDLSFKTFDTSYQQNIAAVQESLHQVLKSFAKEVRNAGRDRNFKPSENFEKACQEANNGNVINMNYIGNCYYEGTKVHKSEADAYLWYQAAADRGYHWGMFNVGKCYRKGIHVAQNDEKAKEWYKLAADLGNFWASVALAELGDAESMKYVSDCYLEGSAADWGVKKDLEKGKEWLEKYLEAKRKQDDKNSPFDWGEF